VLLSIYRSTSQGPQREIPRSYRKARWELQVQTLNRHKRLPPARLAYTGVVATRKTISNSGLLTQTSWLATVITCFHVAVTPQLSPATRDLHRAAIQHKSVDSFESRWIDVESRNHGRSLARIARQKTFHRELDPRAQKMMCSSPGSRFSRAPVILPS
jgi:hypothetical protein